MSENPEVQPGAEAAEAPAEASAPAPDLFDQVLDQTTKGRVLKDIKARTTEQKQNAERMIQAFIGQVVDGHVQKTEDLQVALDAAIAQLDEALTRQLNPILHHEQFQKVESAWRGLHYLIHQSETGTQMKIRVLDISESDLADDLMKASDYDQSGLFKAIYDSEYGTPGGEPFGALLGDYYFGNGNKDLAVLEKISEVAAAAHAPFFASAAPSMFGFESFTELMEPRDLAKRFQGVEYARWRSFRDKPESAYVGLTLPKTLGRLPYGEDDELDFTFQEDTPDHDSYLWTNAAYAFGSRLTDAFASHGWCTAVVGKKGGGRVSGLPLHTFKTDDGTVAAKCPTELGITERRDHELDGLGFIPLCHYKNTDYAVFFAAQSTNKPMKFQEADATANASLMAKIPYTMAVCRFAHYLKVIQRDNLGLQMERGEVERELQNWIANYVLLNPEGKGQELKAQKPLAGAEVKVVDVAGAPGHYKATMWLRPHFMLEKLDVSLRLVADLDKPAR